MSDSRVENSLLNRTRLSGFLILSLAIHFILVIVHMATPVREATPKGPPPIQVKYIEQKKTMDKTGQIIDTPTPPKKAEKPRTKKLLAKYDSRAHSNRKKSLSKTYQGKKTVVPKFKGPAEKTGSSSTQKKKTARKSISRSKVEPRKRPLPKSDIGKNRSITKKEFVSPESETKQKAGTRNTLALLDGLDKEKYASLDTGDLESFYDDEPVSLDTKEVKYASYFGRIKHQIERVWIYPSDAAKRGLSGGLNLTFSISKDGNLVGAQITNTSGYEILDMAALKAIKEAAPFYPFPLTIKREKLTIQANFIYTPNFESITP
jgi:periplasmic protein TonB